MSFKKYNIANDAIALLSLPITEVSSTLELKSGYDRFPASNGIIKVTEFDINEVIISQEIMLYSTRSGNILNVSNRHYEAIPKNDSSTSAVSEAYTFTENSVVELVNSAELYKDIQAEITRLETTKLTKGGLRTAMATAWRFLFSNGSSDEEFLAFGTSGKYLKSTGAGSVPEWDNPPLDINGQTTETNPTTSWLVPLYNGVNNVKVTLANFIKGLPTATTSQAGVVEMATDGEAYTGTDETRYINSKQVFGEVSVASGNINIPINTNSFTSFYSYTAPSKGAYNVYYTLHGANMAITAQVRVDGKIQSSKQILNDPIISNETVFLHKGETVAIFANNTSGGVAGTLNVEIKG